MTSHSLTRARIATLALALGSGSLVLAPAQARAGVLDIPTTQGKMTFTAAGTCPATGPGNTTTNNTFAADGVPVVTSGSSSQTVTKTGDPTDVTTMSGSYTQTITVTQAGNALKAIDVVASSQGSLVANLGSAQTCNGQMQAGGLNSGSFDLPSAKYVTIDVDSSGVIGVIALSSLPNTLDNTRQETVYNAHSRSTTTFYLPAGKYLFQNQNVTVMMAPTPTSAQPTSRTGSVSYHVSFDEPGLATSAGEGDGSKYVDLAAGRNCAAGSLTATWKAKAGKGKDAKIKKATFYVNDVKVTSVKTPKKKTTKTLTGLNPDNPADVLVKLKLAKHGAGTVTVERSYLPCT